MLHYIVFLGALVHLYGTWRYLKDTLLGGTKPNRVSFLFWATAPLIAAAAEFADGVRWAVLPVFMSGFGPLLILLASFANKNAYWRLGTFDYLCGLFAALALLLWWLTDEPSIAIGFAIVSDFSAALPTVKKSWTNPETETGISYATSLFSAATAFTAIQMWNFSAVAFPIYLVTQNAILLFAIYRRRLRNLQLPT